jgi:thioredoxin 1
MQVLYFSAPWCSPCKTFKPVVESASSDLGVHVNYVNVDYDASLPQKYSITSVPTIIILGATGDELYRKSGVMSKDELFRVLNQFK